MSQIVLGKVAFVDKGVYATASTYNTFDFVVTDDSCYLCVKDGNKNHPLTCLLYTSPSPRDTR